ncbi:alkaline phosphatase family protein [Flavitalea sp.]|nr:alkaline phosphatase family protein [Flavitalea sp.]
MNRSLVQLKVVFVLASAMFLINAHVNEQPYLEDLSFDITGNIKSESRSELVKPRKVVFVIVDGIPADVIEKVATPALDLIAKQGRYLRATVGGKKNSYSETPTISAVGYNSLLTGTWVNKHNVWDNDIAKPNYHYPTIFRLFKDQYPGKKTGVFSSWEDNRTKLVGEGLEMSKGLKIDFVFDGLENDTIKYPHDSARKYIHLIDEDVVNKAAETIVNHGPDLSWIYLEYTDDMGHMFGDSEPFYNAVRIMDKQVSRLWSSIQSRAKAKGEEWQIYITTDHGRDSISGKGHGRQSDRERSTWIVTNAPDVNNYYNKNKPAIVDIMPSIARFMNIAIPRSQLMEIDGTSLTGKLSAVNPSAILEKNKIVVRWDALEKTGKAKIWIATENNYRLGIPDKYLLAATVPLAGQQASVDLTANKSRFYKIVIETQENFLNCWAGEDLAGLVQQYK